MPAQLLARPYPHRARYGSGAGSPLIAGEAAVATPSSYSYAFWYRNTVAFGATGMTVLAIREPGSNVDCGWKWGHSNASFRHAAYHQRSNGTYVTAQTTTSPAINTWYHVGCVWDGSNLGVFLNGVREANPACATIKGTNPTIRALGIAAASEADINGTIAGVAYWSNVALTQAEMASLAAGAPPMDLHADGLKIYWPMIGDSPEPDYSYHGNRGTVTTATVVAGPPVVDQYQMGTAFV